jgi:hypothetical protein
MKRAALVFLGLVAPAAFGATIGRLEVGGYGYLTANPLTVVNLANPALAAGVVRDATLRWIGAPALGCTNVIKIKVLRAVNGSSGAYTVVGDRGTFNVQNGVNHFTFADITIAEGDVIGVTALNDHCGGVATLSTDSGIPYGTLLSDPLTSVAAMRISYGLAPNIVASTSSEYTYGYLVVAGSVRGNQGSEFKTSMQLSNYGEATITGKLVFHPAGVAAQAGDPSLSYSLTPEQTLSYPDIVQSMSASGVGSIDLVVTSGNPPDVSARIFNDAGANGTSGLTENLLTADQAFHALDFGSIPIPADLTNFRLNVGYRTLDATTQLEVSLYNAAGGFLSGRTLDVGANTFVQQSGADFAGRALPAGGTIAFRVATGTVFVYGATTDNHTNDPNLRFAVRR